MGAGELAACRVRLEEFASGVFAPLVRRDQREKGALYLRAMLAWRAVAAVRPEVWVADDTGFPEDGRSSPGVARQYSGTLGKVGNCGIGVSVHAASDTASCPLSWRLFLPAA